MKAITLWQPWASLVACGAKIIETRSWPTSYRGPLAIHASKNIPKQVSELWKDDAQFRVNARCKLDPVAVLSRMPIGLSDLPSGVIVATCELTDCCIIGEPVEYDDQRECCRWAHYPLLDSLGIHVECVQIGSHELLFGDYTPGRYGWILANIKLPDRPIPAVGKQGLWEWDMPEAAQ